MKISLGDFSADGLARKMERLAANWWVLFAANDVTGLPFIFAKSRENLAAEATHDEFSVPRAVQAACAERLREQTESQELNRYGLTLKEFTSIGKERLSADLYAYLCNRIAQVSLGVDLMVVGFDAKGNGHLVLVGGTTPPAHSDMTGCCAVGSGEYLAMGSLMHDAHRQRLSVRSSVEECVYCCCSAKFMAESANGVGRETFLAIFKHDEPVRFISALRIEDEIRPAWERLEAPQVPASILKAIPEMIFSVGDLAGDCGFGVFLGPKGKKKNRDVGRLIKEFKNLRWSQGLSSDQEPV
jgi:hypothetical protein